jgi:crotonobetainyl-CoA:carnitine CoA-transferase CaiB-like acyl-CoA transferase
VSDIYTSASPHGDGERKPLADVRILAVEQFGAGPWATLQLADLGAEVITIEDPTVGGDVGRYVPPYQDGEDSLFFETFNRGKRSIALDLRAPAGRRAFETLIPHVDGIYANLRGDQPAKLRLRYEDLQALNPRIVCCSLSGFGTSGPRAGEGAYDYVLQAMAGWMSLTGEPDAPPTKTGLSLVDYTAGYVSALALVAGLWRARRDGRGCDCDTSLFEIALAQLTYLATWSATAGHQPQRMAESAHPSITPFQAFRTADGWMTVACAKEKFWVALCEALERTDLLEESRFAGFGPRAAHRDALLDELRPEFRARSTEELVALLQAHRVPCGPVNDVAAALADPQIAARDGLFAYEHPRLGSVRGVASPLRLGTPPDYSPAPQRGADTRRLLTDLAGLSAEQVDELARDGAFGPVTPPRAARAAGAR